MFVVGWWPSSDSLRELDRGRPHHDRQPQFHGRAGRVLLEYVSVFMKAEWSRASIPPRDLRPISSLYRNSKHGPRLTWALTLIHEGSILDITTDSCLSMSKGGHYEYQKQNNGGIDCQYVGAVSVGDGVTTVSVADDAAATTVEPRYGEKTTMTLISTAKKPSSPNRNSSAEDINFLKEVAYISTPKKVGQQALRSLHLGGLSQSRQPWGLLGKPALPVIACSRLVLLISIRHASPRITPSNIIVLTTTSTESRSELFIRTCMSRYLKLHILSASHKFAYRRESS